MPQLTVFSVLAIAATIVAVVSTLGIAAIGSIVGKSDDPRILGVCLRIARRHGLSVGGLRMLVAVATLLTGVVPGVVAYFAFALLHDLDDDFSVNQPSRPADGSLLLGICRDIAGRLDVPAGRIRALVVVATLFSGIVPGILAYLAAGIVKASVGPEKWGEWLGDRLHGAAPAASPSPGASPAMPGRIGRYRILGLLGRGGMGSVWRGRDDALGRDAAVKVVDGPFGGDAVRRFGEEARAAAALASPHIVQIWEYAPDARPPFLAMEYVPGRSVLQLVRSGGPQSIATALDCARQVLAGLAAAHAAGIVHRDIKPANILLATSGPSAGTYKLTDFGLASSADRRHSLTASGTLLGTLSYLAPEVAIGEDASPASDLYALGATLHEVLLGRPPIVADTPLKLLRRITTEAIPPIATLRPDLPADFAAWIDRLVARDPAGRFRSAEEALASLGDVAGAAEAATDLRGAGTPSGDDALPWHLRPAPGPPPRADVARADLADVVGRAMAFEADGRDALGEDSILDIARELNIDTRAVREVLVRHRRGEGVTGVFRRALGGTGRAEGRRGPFEDDVALAGSARRRRIGRWVVLGVAIGAGLVLAMTLLGVRRVRQEVDARRIEEVRHEWFRERLESRPAGAAAEAESAPGEARPRDSAPGPEAPTFAAAPRASDSAGAVRGTWASLGVWVVITLVGAFAAAMARGRRRRPAAASERKWH